MKRLFFISFVFICGLAYGQDRPHAKAAVSLGIASLISENAIAIKFCHRFGEGWSAGGGFFIPYSNDRASYPEFTMGIRYWPGSSLEGPYIGLGCRHNLISGPEMTAGCGYSIRIWRCIGLSIGYELRIPGNAKSTVIKSDGITIDLNFRF